MCDKEGDMAVCTFCDEAEGDYPGDPVEVLECAGWLEDEGVWDWVCGWCAIDMGMEVSDAVCA